MTNNYNRDYDYSTDNTAQERKPGRAGAVVRLIITALFSLLAIVGTVAAAIDVWDRGFGAVITDAIAAPGLVLLCALTINLLIIGMGYAVRIGFRGAVRFWRAWSALTYTLLIIKAWVFIIILLAPISLLTGVLSSAIFMAAGAFSMDYNIITSLVTLAISGTGTLLLARRDIGKLIDR